jgi:Domain of unknown function (DUF5658)
MSDLQNVSDAGRHEETDTLRIGQGGGGGPPPPPPSPPPRLCTARDQLLFWLLLELWLLNVADLLLTRYGLWLGFATESNGVMSYFLHEGTLTASTFKIGIVSAGALGLWRVRGHRGALLGALCLTAVFAAVVAYQAAWALSL